MPFVTIGNNRTIEQRNNRTIEHKHTHTGVYSKAAIASLPQPSLLYTFGRPLAKETKKKKVFLALLRTKEKKAFPNLLRNKKKKKTNAPPETDLSSNHIATSSSHISFFLQILPYDILHHVFFLPTSNRSGVDARANLASWRCINPRSESTQPSILWSDNYGGGF